MPRLRRPAATSGRAERARRRARMVPPSSRSAPKTQPRHLGAARRRPGRRCRAPRRGTARTTRRCTSGSRLSPRASKHRRLRADRGCGSPRARRASRRGRRSPGSARACRARRATTRSVTWPSRKTRDPVAEVEHLVEAVRHVEDRDAGRRQVAHDPEQRARSRPPTARRSARPWRSAARSATSARPIMTMPPVARRSARRPAGRAGSRPRAGGRLDAPAAGPRRQSHEPEPARLAAAEQRCSAIALKCGTRLSSWWMNAKPEVSGVPRGGDARPARPSTQDLAGVGLGRARPGSGSGSTCRRRSRRPARAPRRRCSRGPPRQRPDAGEVLARAP